MAKKYKVIIYDSTGEDELDDVYSSLSDAMDAGCQALGEIAVGMEMLHYADSDEYPQQDASDVNFRVIEIDEDD